MKQQSNKRVSSSTSRRQSFSVRRRIHRVPGMDLVLTTRYFPLGFHTSIDIGFAMAKAEIAAARRDKVQLVVASYL
jgi:hypothetical protein